MRDDKQPHLILEKKPILFFSYTKFPVIEINVGGNFKIM